MEEESLPRVSPRYFVNALTHVKVTHVKVRTRIRSSDSSFLVVTLVVKSCHRICWFVGNEGKLLHNSYLETETGITSVTGSHP